MPGCGAVCQADESRQCSSQQCPCLGRRAARTAAAAAVAAAAAADYGYDDVVLQALQEDHHHHLHSMAGHCALC
eukprot:1158449-Pelagomonas_calceolata.AAC.5